MTALRLEFFKTNRRGLWVIVGALVAVELLWQLWNFHDADETELKWGWMGLLYTMPLLHAIIFPTIVGVLASRLADLEHKSHSLRLLETMQPADQLFAAKYLCGACYVLAVCMVEFAVMRIAGAVFGFWGTPDVWAYALSFAFELATGLELLAIQLALSMNIRNQMVSLAIGCGGSFVGLLLMFLPQLPILRLLLPWGHTGGLMFVGMDWNEIDRFQGYYYMDINWTALMAALLCMAVVLFLGQWIFCRKEVR